MPALAAAQEQKLGARLPWETNPLIEENVLKSEEYEDQKKLIEAVAEVEAKTEEIKEEPVEKLNNGVMVLKEEIKPVVEEAKPVSEPSSDEVRIKINEPATHQEVPAATVKEEVPAPAEAVTASVEVKVEESKEAPLEQDAELKELESVYKDIGRILIDNWREYVSKYQGAGNGPNMPPEFFQKAVLAIDKAGADFNEERKKQGKEIVDIDLPVLTGLNEIYKRIVILRLTEGTNTKPIESLDSVMKNEIGQWLNIGSENRLALEEYITGMAEQLSH